VENVCGRITIMGFLFEGDIKSDIADVKILAVSLLPVRISAR